MFRWIRDVLGSTHDETRAKSARTDEEKRIWDSILSYPESTWQRSVQEEQYYKWFWRTKRTTTYSATNLSGANVKVVEVDDYCHGGDGGINAHNYNYAYVEVDGTKLKDIGSEFRIDLFNALKTRLYEWSRPERERRERLAEEQKRASWELKRRQEQEAEEERLRKVREAYKKI